MKKRDSGQNEKEIQSKTPHLQTTKPLLQLKDNRLTIFKNFNEPIHN